MMRSFWMPSNESSAWDPIDKPTIPNEEVIRRADAEHELDFFRGKDFMGRNLFMFRTPRPPGRLPEIPRLAEIDAVFEQFDSDTYQLKLVLNNPNHADIFGSLCANLIEGTRGFHRENTAEAVSAVISRLAHWQGMLRRGRPEVLSEIKQLGLYGELLVLKEIILQYFPLKNAVKSWRGPYGDEQDFSINNVLIEVKTQRDSADRKLSISSLDQLNTDSGPIFICHQTLTTHDDQSIGTSLRQLVNELLALAHETDAITTDTLSAGLREYGYEDHDEYDIPYRSLQKRTVYRISESFPRIVPNKVDIGISSAEYTITIEAAEPFKTDPTEIWSL